MPLRVLRPGVLDSPDFETLSTGAQALLYRLFRACDDYGHYPADPAAIQTLYGSTVDAGDIEAWIVEAAAHGVLYLYDVDGRRYLEINPFHQRIQSRPKWPGRVPPASPCSVSSVVVVNRTKQQTTKQTTAPPSKAPPVKKPGMVERVKKLVQRGVAAAIAEGLALALPDGYNLDATLAYADRNVAGGRIKNPPGFLVWLLRDRWAPPAAEVPDTVQERQESATAGQTGDDYGHGEAVQHLAFIENQKPGEFRRLYEAAKVEILARMPWLENTARAALDCAIRNTMLGTQARTITANRRPPSVAVPFQHSAVAYA